MTTHSLKTLAPYWDAVFEGTKRFEVRRDDRGFQRGDTLLLRRMCRDRSQNYEGRDGPTSIPDLAHTIVATVDWVLTGGQLGIEPGYVVMSMTIVSKPEV